VVREAQIETSLSFPPELEEPWLLLQRYFGFTSPGGGLSTCLYFNTRGVDTNFKPFYSSVHGLPQLHQKTADWDARLFLETEHRVRHIPTMLHPGLTDDQSLPMYRLIAETIAACGSFAGDFPLDALTSLKEANTVFQNTYHFFFENMKDANISHALWLAYLQGYTGWALLGADGVVVSGVSGGHSLTIRTLDAFLGILPVPPAEEEALHLPVAQRDWLRSLREVCCFTYCKSSADNDSSMTSERKFSPLSNDAQTLQTQPWRSGRECRTSCIKWFKSFGYDSLI
jgi:hypothetical protein